MQIHPMDEVGIKTHFYAEFAKRLGDSVGGQEPSAADVQVALQLTANAYGKSLIQKKILWDKTFSLDLLIDETSLHRKSYFLPTQNPITIRLSFVDLRNGRKNRAPLGVWVLLFVKL